MALVCGIDEAGRGPVIGPLVIAAAVMEESELAKLKEIGVKDSKLLSPLQRERLFHELKKILHSCKIIELSPLQIDNALNDPNTNLNWLEMDNAVLLIDELRPDKVIIDAPSNNIPKVKEYVMRKMVNKRTKVILEHKADLNHEIVGAASILAKVTRDSQIEKIKKEIGINFGSGYPADPLTAEFLKKSWSRYPHIFRKTWKSYTNIAQKTGQKGLGEF